MKSLLFSSCFFVRSFTAYSQQKIGMKNKQLKMQQSPAGRACTSQQMIALEIIIFENLKTQSFIVKRTSLVLN